MFEFTGTIKDMTLDWKTGKALLTLSLNDKQSAMRCFDELNTADQLSIKVAKYRIKRSLDANSFAWLLLGKLSAKINIPPVEIYRQLIMDVGDNYEIMPIRNDAVEFWRSTWQSRGLGWICEKLDDSKIEGYSNMICFYGSSVYDTAQMSRLIQMIVDECKAQGIDTRTPDEINNMLSLWESKR